MLQSVRRIAAEHLGASPPLSIRRTVLGKHARNLHSLAEQLKRIQDLGVLTLLWAATIDNGEGDDAGLGVFRHGPIGNLHILVYETEMHLSLHQDGKRTDYPPPLRHLVLRGPTENEWDDGDHLAYDPPVQLFQWRSLTDAITLFIYESDRDTLGPFTQRVHDPLFLDTISRRETLVTPKSCCGPWQVNDQALRRATRRGGDDLLQALIQRDAWDGGWSAEIPKMFLQLATVPTWSELAQLKEARV